MFHMSYGIWKWTTEGGTFHPRGVGVEVGFSTKCLRFSKKVARFFNQKVAQKLLKKSKKVLFLTKVAKRKAFLCPFAA